MTNLMEKIPRSVLSVWSKFALYIKIFVVTLNRDYYVIIYCMDAVLLMRFFSWKYPNSVGQMRNKWRKKANKTKLLIDEFNKIMNETILNASYTFRLNRLICVQCMNIIYFFSWWFFSSSLFTFGGRLFWMNWISNWWSCIDFVT